MTKPATLFKRGTCLIVFLAIAACSTNSGPLVLTAESYGDVEFGTPLDEIEARLRESALPQTRPESCSFISFANYPDIEFMVENGIVTRADAGKTIANAAGATLGGESAELQKTGPQVRTMPHKYDPAGHYLILDTADGKSALVFEESGGVITRIRGGIKPSVEYVERCG